MYRTCVSGHVGLALYFRSVQAFLITSATDSERDRDSPSFIIGCPLCMDSVSVQAVFFHLI